MTTALIIDGATVNRPASRIVLNRLNLALDGFDSLEFTEMAVKLPGSFTARKSCELVVDGTTRFKGQVVSSYYSGIGSGPINVGYRALGLDWLANRIQITAADGSGQLTYNLPETDPDYLPANSGLAVGDILKKLFDLHSTQLTAAGVSGYVAADLTALTAVPPEPVLISGWLWNSVRSLIAQWCNKYVAYIDPSDSQIHVVDQLTMGAETLTLDSDPIVLESLSRDNSECFTSVACRGRANVQAAFLTLTKDATIAAGWTSAEQLAWSYNDFIVPKDSADLGTVSAMTSTTLTVSSDDAAKTWAANYWGPLNAEVVAYNPAATGITFSESRRITANTALTAGGSSTLTVDVPFANSGYTRYSIRGMYAPDSLVWRKYTTPITYVAEHLVKSFSHSVPWSPVDGVVTQTTTPQALICWSPTCSTPYYEWPATFQIVPYDGTTPGYFIFNEPVLRPFGTMSKLIAGGSAVDGIPCEIKMLVPYSVGAMTSAAPTTGYEGTAYSTDGLSNVLYRDFPFWSDYKDVTSYATLAQEVLDTVKNTVIEGSLTYFGKYSTALAKGTALNLAAVGYTTGYESMAAPIRNVTLDYAPNGGSASQWITRIQFSNRLKPFSGDRLYAHPVYSSQGALSDRSLVVPQASMPAPVPTGDGGDGFGFALDMGDPGAPGRYHRPKARKRRPVDAAKLADARKTKALNTEGASNEAAWRKQMEREQLAANNADDRRNRHLVARRASRRAATRLSGALGNPLGPKPFFQPKEEFQADRDVDAMLANLMHGRKKRRPGGSTGNLDAME